jgi:hypothetical protein
VTDPQDPFAPPPPGHPPTPWAQPPQPSWGEPQWGDSAYPYVQPPRTNVLAIIALVTTVLCLPASVVLGVIALVQVRRSGERGRGLAIAALVVDAVLVVLLAVFIGLAASGALDGPAGDGLVGQAGATTAGACLVSSGDGGSSEVPCTEDHDEEVFYVGALDEGAYPGDDEVLTEADAACAQHYRSYVGAGYDNSSLDYDYYSPDGTEWASGEHRVVCVITTQLWTGSVRSSGR